jgi:thymidylate kinase
MKKHLFIFEGPDRVGKSTLALALTNRIDGWYSHHGAYNGIMFDLANIYEDAMRPAITGESHVVMDRSWLSEMPYCLAYRNGFDRLGSNVNRLEDIALKNTRPLVIRCDGDYQTVLRNYRLNREQEYLDNEDQLRQVWQWYRTSFRTSLPHIVIRPFEISSMEAALGQIMDAGRSSST